MKRSSSGRPVPLTVSNDFVVDTYDWTYDGHVKLAISFSVQPSFNGTLVAVAVSGDGYTHKASVACDAGDWDQAEVDLGSVFGDSAIDCWAEVRDLNGELIRKLDVFEIV